MLARTLLTRTPAGVAVPAVSYGRLLALWLVVRTVVWLLTLVTIHPNAPLDVIELLGWGNAWAAGYAKHPPLPCWTAAAFGRLSPGDVWGVYVAGYLASACCLWAAWSVGGQYLSPRLAFLAAVSLDGLLYLTIDAAEWNNNVALNVGWALTVAFGAKAVRTGSTGWWVATGFAAAVAVLSKYTAAFLFAPLLAYLVLSPRGRVHLRRPGPYLAAVVALGLFAPHAVWVIEHDFITLKFVAGRIAESRGAIRHLTNPLAFVAFQAAVITPIVFILYPLLRRTRTAPAEGDADRWFLRAAVLAPFGLFVLYGVITGCQLRDIWGATFWTFLGVWLLAEFGRTGDDAAAARATRRWAWVAAAVLVVFVAKIVGEPYLAKKGTRPTFPGKPLAAEVGRLWAEKYDRPFGVVAGEGWLAGNVACYSRHRPTLYTNWDIGYIAFDEAHSPWTGDADVNARGGVIVWFADLYGEDVPAVIRERFPRVVSQPPVVLPYQTGAKVAPVRVGLAFVPPAGE